MKNSFFIDHESENRLISHRVKNIIFTAQTEYQFVEIMDTYEFGIMLILDGKIQSAESDEYIYHEALVHPAMFAHPKPENVLILGGGEGATIREALVHPSVKRVVMIDIDRELVQICRKRLKKWHRGAFDDSRTEVICQDAIAYVHDTYEKYDVIIADLSDPLDSGCSLKAYTIEFYQAISEILSKDGIFVTQAAELYHDNPKAHSIIHNTIGNVFPRVASYCEYIPSFGSMWGFVIATKMDEDFYLDRQRLDAIKYRFSFYNYDTHQRMFIIPPLIKKAIKRQKTISTNAHPVSVYCKL